MCWDNTEGKYITDYNIYVRLILIKEDTGLYYSKNDSFTGGVYALTESKKVYNLFFDLYTEEEYHNIWNMIHDACTDKRDCTLDELCVAYSL